MKESWRLGGLCVPPSKLMAKLGHSLQTIPPSQPRVRTAEALEALSWGCGGAAVPLYRVLRDHVSDFASVHQG